METILTHQETLVFYDIPQLFIAQDKVGTKFLCMLSEQTDEYDIVLCVPVSSARLHLFLIGSVELLEMFMKPELSFLYKANVSSYRNNFFTASSINVNEIKEKWLPETGYFYLDHVESKDAVIIESKEKSRGIVHLSFKNEETKYDSIVNSNKLSIILYSFQDIIKYSYKKYIKHNCSQKEMKKLNKPENYSVDVFAFSPGSFEVKLQSQVCSSLLGISEIEKSFSIIDELTGSIQNIDNFIEVIKKYKGHFAKSFIKFLKNIADSGFIITYKWGSSVLKESKINSITHEQARELYLAVNNKEELTDETVAISGFLDGADNTPGKWCLKDDQGKLHKGESSIDLLGLVIGRRYIFTCKEKIETTGLDDEKIFLKLKSYEEENVPNKITIDAFNEDIDRMKCFNSLDELREDLLK